jgi:hypothetical protein
MDQKFMKRMMIVILVFTFISFGNITRLKGIEDVRAIEIVSLLTCGIGIGAFLVMLVLFIKSRKGGQVE